MMPPVAFGLGELGFVEEVRPGLVLRDHTVDGAPVGEAAEVTVIDEEVNAQLAGEILIAGNVLLREVAIDGPEFHAAITAPLNSIF